MKKMVEICFLKEYPSLLEGLLDLERYSKNKIKKYVPKKKLSQTVESKKEFSISLNLINDGKISAGYQGPQINIIQEDNDFLCLSKPARVHCHPLTYLETDNILSALTDMNKTEALKVNYENYDRGLLYRLDYETSGLVILIKNENLFNTLRNDFHTLVKEKYYLAIVRGEVKKKKQSIQNYLAPSEGRGRKMKVVEYSEYRAECELEVLDYNSEKDLSLLKVKLLQGHRHQIRTQLSSIGYPILNDPLYSNPAVATSERMYLHCWKYKLEVDGKEREFKDSNLKSFANFFDLNGEF